MSTKPHDVPTTVTVENGEVMLDGPNGLAVSFTPEAASKSAAAIVAAVDEARTRARDSDGGD